MPPKKSGKKSRSKMGVSATATVVLSGGAPNSPLMAGALAAIYDGGKTFDTFYTSGAGATVGLIFLASRLDDTCEALKQTLDAGISDSIYRAFPVGYKAFFKSGPFTVPFLEWGSMFRMPGPCDRPEDRFKRLYNDWLDFWVTAMTPSDVNFFSKGLCAPYPFINQVVDFDKLRRFKGRFFMNAYCIDDARMVEFAKEEIRAEHFAAALSFPFVYSPTEIDGKQYFEGSAHDPLNLPKLHSHIVGKHFAANTVVILDVLGSLKSALIRVPRNLMDAYGISILTPIVSLAEKNFETFKREVGRDADYEMLQVKFEIPDADKPFVTDWSVSNMKRCWEIGYKTGREFCEKFGHLLPDREKANVNPLL